MINSGLSMLRSLYILAEQTEQAARRTVSQVRVDVERGSSLSAVAKHPKGSTTCKCVVLGGPVVCSTACWRLGVRSRSRSSEPQGEVRDDLPGGRLVPGAGDGLGHAARHSDVPEHLCGAGGTLPAPTLILIKISALVHQF
jgi:hypothetical protein